MGWPAVVTALATAVIALAVLVLMVGGVVVLRRLDALSQSVTRLVDTFERDARPALDSVRRTADEASRMAVLFRDEAEGYASASRRFRKRAERIGASLEERFLDLEALLDVLQDEVEATVLDVAAVLRTTRRGGGVFRAAKRVLLGRRR